MEEFKTLDVNSIRQHFLFPEGSRTITNNAASTQPPRELVNLYYELAKNYENVHRGQSDASQQTTKLFEESYDTIAQFIMRDAVKILFYIGMLPKL